MEKLNIIWRIVELLIAVVGASLLTRVLTIRERVKQEKANALRMEEEVKASQIENVRKIVDDIYQPAIKDLKDTIGELRDEIGKVKDENGKLKKEIAEVKAENSQLRNIIREINPDLIPSKRSERARRQSAGRPRNSNGQFAKKGEA